MVLEVRQLSCVRGGRRLFQKLGFSLNPGELLHVHGANGSGKTSLLRIVTGLSRPEAGAVHWGGSDIRQVREEFLRAMVYLGHQPAVKDDLNVYENLQVSLSLAGQQSSSAAIRSALDALGLDGCARLPARVLSQGQRRRLALARLWLTERPLWVLDEPYTALDANAAAMLEERLEKHLSSAGMVLMTTHLRPTVAERYLRVLVMEA